MESNQEDKTEVKQKRVLSEEALEKLKKAREKAMETKKKLAVIRDANKTKKKNELETKYNEAKEILEPPQELPQEPPQKPPQEPKEESAVRGARPPKKKKKIVKRVIEISESETETESESESETESESEIEEEYVVKKKPRAKPMKKPARKASTRNYETRDLTPMVARDLLKEKVMSDAQRMAFSSLFPYHNF